MTSTYQPEDMRTWTSADAAKLIGRHVSVQLDGIPHESLITDAFVADDGYLLLAYVNGRRFGWMLGDPGISLTVFDR